MNHGDQASQERDDAHELAEALREQAINRETPRDLGFSLDALNASVLWLAAETRAARLDRGCEIGGP